MQIYPAIDLLDGRCVRLVQGDFDQSTDYGGDPIAVARDYRKAGATWLHLVDLSGAKAGRPVQTDLIRRVVASAGIPVQVGGGVRDVAALGALFDVGVARVIVGSRAVSDPTTVADWMDHFGAERVALALDVRMDGAVPMVATHGWRQTGGASLWEVMARYVDRMPAHVICTDIGRDGVLGGPNLDLYAAFADRYPAVRLQASGGTGDLSHVRALKTAARVDGLIIGKALFAGRFTLAEALAC